MGLAPGQARTSQPKWRHAAQWLTARTANDDWLAVDQFTAAEGQHIRRPGVVLFVNGLPLAVIELKNPTDENVTVWSAWRQLATYQEQIPPLFATNEALVVSDGVEARIGALGAGKEWFKPWRTISGAGDAAASMFQFQVVLEEMCPESQSHDVPPSPPGGVGRSY